MLLQVRQNIKVQGTVLYGKPLKSVLYRGLLILYSCNRNVPLKSLAINIVDGKTTSLPEHPVAPELQGDYQL